MCGLEVNLQAGGPGVWLSAALWGGVFGLRVRLGAGCMASKVDD